MRQAIQKPADLTAANERLRLRLVADGVSLSQHVEAVHSGTILLDAGRQDIILNLGGQVFALPYEQARLIEAGKSGARLRAGIERPEFEITTMFELCADGSMDIITALAPRTIIPLISIEHHYAFPPAIAGSESPHWDYMWLPHLKARQDHLVGQHAFRAPAFIIQRGPNTAAILPALELITPGMPTPAALDFRGAEDVRYGLVPHRVVRHIFYQREAGHPKILNPGQAVRFGFKIIAGDDMSAQDAVRRVVRTLWEKYGRGHKPPLDPQTIYFDDSARYAYDGIFERQSVWRDVELPHHQPAGGISVHFRQPRSARHGISLPVSHKIKVTLQQLLSPAIPLSDKLSFVLLDGMRSCSAGLYFSVWFNNMRTAFGLAHFGQKWGDNRLMEAAQKVKNLICTAPTVAGLFPVGYIGSKRRAAWLKGTRAFFVSSYYGTADLAETGAWMLAYHREFEDDPALIERCRALGETLLAVQAEDGSLPAWLTVDEESRPHPAKPLHAGATTAAGGRFLNLLAETTGDLRYAEGACRAADFIIQRVWPTQEWSNFETLFSCAGKPAAWRDPVSRLSPQSALAVAWGAALMGGVYRLVGSEQYLAYGVAMLNALLLFQQVWNAPFLSYRTFGGFGAMNIDAQWGDARGALFVPLLLDYYDLTGESEYFERAIAALRAAFVLMYTPENLRVAPGLAAGMTEATTGLLMENYGHSGTDQPTRGHFYPDWGAGSACTAAAVIQRRLGDLFVDAGRGKAFGINGCRVLNHRISMRLIDLHIERLAPYDAPNHRTPLNRELATQTLIKCVGLPPSRQQMALWINTNELGVYTPDELAAGVIYHPSMTQE